MDIVVNEKLQETKGLYTGYTYYIPLYSSEHFMYAHEVAEYLMNNMGWVTSYGKRPTKFVTLFIDNLIQTRGEKPVFYENKFGLSKVYCKQDIDTLIRYLDGLDEAGIQDSKGNMYNIYRNFSENIAAAAQEETVPAA